MPVVSVVIPTYNRAELLPRTIDSVLDQTFEKFEVIVVDDDSMDDTADVVRQYNDDRVHYIRHGQNRGGSAARNTGIEAATGEFVAFLDDDDVWRANKLDAQIERYERADEEVGVVYTGIENVDSERRTNAMKTPQKEGNVTKQLLLDNFIGTFSAVMIDAETIEATGLLDERFPSWQDWEYYLRLSGVAEFAAVTEPLTVRDASDHEQISEDFGAKHEKAYPLLVEAFDPVAEEYGWWFKRRMHALLRFRLGYAALSQGHYGAARRLLTRAILSDPFTIRMYVYWVLSLGGNHLHEPARRTKRYLTRLVN